MIQWIPGEGIAILGHALLNTGSTPQNVMLQLASSFLAFASEVWTTCGSYSRWQRGKEGVGVSGRWSTEASLVLKVWWRLEALPTPCPDLRTGVETPMISAWVSKIPTMKNDHTDSGSHEFSNILAVKQLKVFISAWWGGAHLQS